jgi:hypothetical protein
MDIPHAVEICSAAYYGDEQAVGIRPSLPADPVAADLLALAEERFQRPFGVKDIVDVLVLSRVADLNVQDLARYADEYLLAPELRELLGLADGYVNIGCLDKVREMIEDAARKELARRDAVAPIAGSTCAVHGYLLMERAWDNGFSPAVVHRWDEGSILRTPVGDYLLVSGAVVKVAEYEEALRELRELPVGSTES